MYVFLSVGMLDRPLEPNEGILGSPGDFEIPEPNPPYDAPELPFPMPPPRLP